jgi:hypothetical protein
VDPPIKIHPDDVLKVLRPLNGAPPKELLENDLKRVDKNVRDDVVRVLYDAKVEKILSEMEGRRIDYVRKLRKRTCPALADLRGVKHFLSTNIFETNIFDDTSGCSTG